MLNEKIWITIAGIFSLTALEIAAMCTSQDGEFMLPIVGLIGFLCGLPINTTGWFNANSKGTAAKKG